MITRVRLEAEGPTPDLCRNDLYAAANLLTGGSSVAWVQGVREEIYEKLDPTEQVPRLESFYRGRLVFGLAVDPPEHTYYAAKLNDYLTDITKARAEVWSQERVDRLAAEARAE